MKNITIISALIGLILISAGCTPMQSKKEQVATTKQAPITPQIPHEDLSAEMLFHVLKAELALYENNYDAALSSYSWIVENTNDYRLIRRATRIALGAKHNLLAMKSINRWLEVSPKDPEAIQLAAIVSLRLGKTDDALKHLDTLLNLDNQQDKEQLFGMLAATLKGESDQEQTLQSLKKLSAKYPQDPYLAITVAELEFQNKLYQQALKTIDQILKIKTDWQRALTLKARTLFSLEQFNDSQKLFEQIFANDPENIQPRITYARSLLTIGNVDAALDQLREIISIAPDNHEIILYTIPLLISSERFDVAEEYINALLEKNISTETVIFQKGVLRQEQGKTQEAKKYFEQINTGQNFIEAQFRLAQIIANEGDLEKALALLQELRKKHPTHTIQTHLMETEILRTNKMYKRALALISEAIEQDQNNDQLLYNRAMLAVDVKDLELAEKDLRKVIELAPDHAHAYNALGYTLADETDRYEEAKTLIEKAYALLPNDVAIIDSMGWVHYKLGNYDLAKKYLLQALKMRKDPEIASHMGQLLITIGKKKEAKEFLQGVLEQFPENEIILEVLKQLQDQKLQDKNQPKPNKPN